MRYVNKAPGNLGTALASYMLRAVKDSEKQDVSIKRLLATTGSDASRRRVQDVLSDYSSRVETLVQQENVRAMTEADVVIIAVKPVKRAELFGAPGAREALRGKLVISIMAGVSLRDMSRLLLGASPSAADSASLQIVRAMPNMAAKIGRSVTLYTANMETLTPNNLELTSWIFNQVGTSQISPESTFDVSAVLVGCAGSLLLLAIDGLLDAAVAEGVKRSEAQKLVVDSAIGMISLTTVGSHPSVLREEIASPGGCSIRALLELERLGVRSAFTTAILAAVERSKAISESR